jgi:trehalose-phosphatase
MNLFKNFKSIHKRIKGRQILLLLDYDGTLTPIVSRPEIATLTRGRRKALRLTSKSPKITLGIISGRSLKDVRNKVKLSGIYYAGNHGFEISGPGVNITHMAAKKFRPVAKEIKGKLIKDTRGIKGVIVEDKGITLSVHYRLVKRKDLKKLNGILRRILAPYLKNKKIKLTEGKKVYEIRPPIKWDKGRAVLWLLSKLRAKKPFPIYAGDDITDESAFRALRGKGMTVVVGRRNSSAKYFVKDVSGIYGLIKLLLRK